MIDTSVSCSGAWMILQAAQMLIQGILKLKPKLLVSPFISPVVIPKIIHYVTPFKEFRLRHI